MHNCLILGSGRSGTSVTTGLLASAGYHCGANLMATREANPRGFFEDHLVNWVNERILREKLRTRVPDWLGPTLGRIRYQPGQAWLAELPGPVHWHVEQAVQWVIGELVSRAPFAYKDPRLSWTLNAWRPHLRDCRFICVFRHPSVTAASIVREVSEEPYYRNLRVDAAKALRVWRGMYRQILDFHCTDPGNWFFLDYDQLVGGAALGPLGRFLAATLDGALLDPALNRSRAGVEPGAAEAGLYAELRTRAVASQRDWS